MSDLSKYLDDPSAKSFCPQCGTAYQESLPDCADCGASLLTREELKRYIVEKDKPSVPDIAPSVEQETPSSLLCVHCSRKNPFYAFHCAQCGKPLESLPEDEEPAENYYDAFCITCGKPITEPQQTTATPIPSAKLYQTPTEPLIRDARSNYTLLAVLLVIGVIALVFLLPR